MDDGLQVNEEEALGEMGTAEGLSMCEFPVSEGYLTLLGVASALADGAFGHSGTAKWGHFSLKVQQDLLGSLNIETIKSLAKVMPAEHMLGGRDEPAGKQHGGKFTLPPKQLGAAGVKQQADASCSCSCLARQPDAPVPTMRWCRTP